LQGFELLIGGNRNGCRQLFISMPKNFIVPLVVYPFDVMVSLGETDKELFDKLRKKGISEDELQEVVLKRTTLARYCLFDCGASLIRMRNIPKTNSEYGHLQHEIFHAVSSILWSIGMKLEIKTSDEAYAYLIGYLTQEIYKMI
jgi:hypothetical protein